MKMLCVTSSGMTRLPLHIAPWKRYNIGDRCSQTISCTILDFNVRGKMVIDFRTLLVIVLKGVKSYFIVYVSRSALARGTPGSLPSVGIAAALSSTPRVSLAAGL